MQAVGKLVSEQGIDDSLTIQPAFVNEFSGYDLNPVVRFTAFARAGMAGMEARFVSYFKLQWF
jgi:hypothetical protein